MAKYPNSSTQIVPGNTGAQQQDASQQPTGASGGGKKMIIIIGVVIIVIAVIAAFYLSSSPSLPALTQTKSQNSTPIYMSAQQAQAIIGSSIAGYNSTDLFNQNSSVNMSLLEYSVPSMSGNVTSAWLSAAYGSNSVTNATIEYYAFTTSNTGKIANEFGNFIVSSINESPSTVNTGAYKGFNYTYGMYKNATTTIQVLYGWKGSNAVMLLLTNNINFSGNETQMIGVAANDS